jgi:hypothetical protein
VKKLVFSEGELPILVEVRSGVERRLYMLNRGSRQRCAAMLQGVPEALVRELEKGKSYKDRAK